jgi:glycosyltransferase involved in cell wall biosynthesis
MFNEENGIPELARRLGATMNASPYPAWEWFVVDDGSHDNSFCEIQKHLSIAPFWQLLRLSRNFGQQAAYRAGLEAASGEAVIFMDADMQDPPELIPQMLELWAHGKRLVVGQRTTRPEKGLRRFLIGVFHEVFHFLTRGAIPKNSGTFGLMDRRLVDELKAMPERGLFLPAQRGWLGFPSANLLYERAARADEPKQSYSKLFSYAWEGITSFSTLPLQLISLAGFLVSLFGFGYAAALLGIRLLQVFGFFPEFQVLGFTTLSVAILCLGGIQLLSLGLIGAYLAKVFQEVKRRPHFITSEHHHYP